MPARTNLANEEVVAPGIKQPRKDSHCFLVAMPHETVRNSQFRHTIRKTLEQCFPNGATRSTGGRRRNL